MLRVTEPTRRRNILSGLYKENLFRITIRCKSLIGELQCYLNIFSLRHTASYHAHCRVKICVENQLLFSSTPTRYLSFKFIIFKYVRLLSFLIVSVIFNHQFSAVYLSNRHLMATQHLKKKWKTKMTLFSEMLWSPFTENEKIKLSLPDCFGIILSRTRGIIFGQSSTIIFLSFVSFAFIFPVILILSEVRTKANNVVVKWIISSSLRGMFILISRC